LHVFRQVGPPQRVDGPPPHVLYSEGLDIGNYGVYCSCSSDILKHKLKKNCEIKINRQLTAIFAVNIPGLAQIYNILIKKLEHFDQNCI